MTYETWITLTDEQKQKVQNEELPVIPQEMLQNDLTSAKVVRTPENKLMWEIVQNTSNGSERMQFPELRKRMVNGQPMWYRFNPLTGLYSLNLTNTETSLEEEPVGIYGQRWMEFMEENHVYLMEQLRMENRFLTVARIVDEEAMEYRMRLDQQYLEENPRPRTFEETVSWERARMMYSDGTVMREKVLIPRTE